MLETLLTNGLAWGGMIGSVILILVGHLTKKYLIPFLVIGKRRKYAKWIAGIADEVTDDLRARYPENEWLEHLDEAVDKIIEICQISTQIGRRAAQAAVSRKK
jgi:hypothetical protein